MSCSQERNGERHLNVSGGDIYYFVLFVLYNGNLISKLSILSVHVFVFSDFTAITVLKETVFTQVRLSERQDFAIPPIVALSILSIKSHSSDCMSCLLICMLGNLVLPSS